MAGVLTEQRQSFRYMRQPQSTKGDFPLAVGIGHGGGGRLAAAASKHCFLKKEAKTFAYLTAAVGQR
jgi:hypothetical protein